MKVPSIAVTILLVVAVVQSRNIHRTVDADGFDDEADSQEVVFDEETYFPDDNGNLIELYDEPDDETVEQTEIVISERVFFHLYTRKNPTTSQELIIGDTTILSASNWDAKKPTRIITHGWMNSHQSPACTSIRDEYLTNGDHNIVVVDWAKIAKRSYGFASRRIRTVSNYGAKMIDFLVSQGMDASETVVVGHSLGGHVAGISSRMASSTIGNVVGLDPAGPYFWFSGPGNRIDKTDGTYVQIIHTNGGKLGYKAEIGHVDFYPNGGSSQNGCGWDLSGACSHSRAYMYFAESINSNTGFWGLECNTWRRFRYGRCGTSLNAHIVGKTAKNTDITGAFYFRTNAASPFAMGNAGF